MSIPTKAFYAHSDRWVKAKLKVGIDPKRWDQWLRLSKKTKLSTSIEDYARGVTVAEQRRRVAVKRAIDRAMRWAGANAPDPIVFEKRMKNHKLSELRKFASMSDSQIRGLNMAARKSGTASPFWYHS